MGYRIGVDIGGTFTDLLVADAEGQARVYKAPTTPDDPTIGFFSGLERAAEDLDLELGALLAQVDTIVHGTTITTNAVLTGNGATTGFVTTKGFRDVLNMRRGLKARQFDKYAPPPPLVPRHRIQVVEERITLDGAVMTPLREEDVRAAAAALREEQVDAVAVSCLWSFRNPEHEQRIGEILQEELPGAYVSLSTEVLPQIRVYERHSTTALNAYVGPILTRYLLRARGGARGARASSGTLLIMQSNGGVMSPAAGPALRLQHAALRPGRRPAAPASTTARRLRTSITVDMGGTSFDVALVSDGVPDGHDRGRDRRPPRRLADPRHPHRRRRRRLDRLDRHRRRCWPSAPPARAPSPGPACYGRGGTQPTVTDADLLLGYLDPRLLPRRRAAARRRRRAAGGRAALAEPARSRASCRRRAASTSVVNANMAAALGVVSRASAATTRASSCSSWPAARGRSTPPRSRASSRSRTS